MAFSQSTVMFHMSPCFFRTARCGQTAAFLLALLAALIALSGLWRTTISTTDRNSRTGAEHRGRDSCTNCNHGGTDSFRGDHLFRESDCDSLGPSQCDSCLCSHTHADPNRYRDRRTKCDANPCCSADFHHHPDQHS